MVNPGPDEQNHGIEYPALENSPAAADPSAPVEYPSEPASPPNYPAPPGYQQPGYQQPGYEQPGYEQPGYEQPGYEQPGYEQPGYEQSGYQQPGYPPAGYEQSGYQQPGYQQAGQPQPDYAQPGYAQTGYPPPPAGYPLPYQGGGNQYGYQPYTDPYGNPYAGARPIGTNGKAIAALVTSLAGLVFCGLPSFVGVILGVLAMRETKRTGQEGHGMALAAVIVGGVVTALFVILFIVYAIGIAAVISDPNFSTGSY